MESINILIADDHEIIHSGIGAILSSRPDYKIAGHAYNGKEAVEQAILLNPHIIFMDISMPLMNGIEATKEIKKVSPFVKVIALSQHEEMEYIRQMLKNGGDGYILKNSKKEDFFTAIDTVLKNMRYLSYELSEKLINSSLSKNHEHEMDEEVHITPRETEIIQEIAEGKSNHQIADNLNISLRTVETHRRNIMQKLKVNTVVALIKYAATHKLIDFQP